jgi:hypothetical protein
MGSIRCAVAQVACAYDYETTRLLTIIDAVAVTPFAADTGVNSKTTLMHRMKLCEDRKIVTKKHLRDWFAIDLMATIPFELIATGLFSESHRVLRLGRLLRLSGVFERALPGGHY